MEYKGFKLEVVNKEMVHITRGKEHFTLSGHGDQVIQAKLAIDRRVKDEEEFYNTIQEIYR